MARFPVYTDADVHGPIVDGLIDRGWDVLRAVDAKPEGTDDIDHFELAVSLSRVMIANDKHMKATAERWIQEGRSFSGLIWWPRKAYAAMSNSEILDAIEELAIAYPHISVTPGVRGGRPCIEGTRISVMDLVMLERMGLPPEEMRTYYSSRPLTSAEGHAALTY